MEIIVGVQLISLVPLGKRIDIFFNLFFERRFWQPLCCEYVRPYPACGHQRDRIYYYTYTNISNFQYFIALNNAASCINT